MTGERIILTAPLVMEPCSKTQGVMPLPRLNGRKGEKGNSLFPLAAPTP